VKINRGALHRGRVKHGIELCEALISSCLGIVLVTEAVGET
jgi:hypothetical protein